MDESRHASEPTLRRQRTADRPAVHAVVLDAFAAQPVVADLVEALQDCPAGAAGMSFVAELDRTIVGHVQLSRSWLDAPERLLEVLVLSPLSVASRQQGQGIGGRLVRHALAAAEAAQAPLVFLEGSPAYYPRFGFSPGSEHGFTAPSVRIPAAAFQVAILSSWQPWMSGALVYADQFWSFDCVGLR